MEGFTQNNADTVPQAEELLKHVVLFLKDVDQFVDKYQAGSERIRYVKQVTFVAEESDGPCCDPFSPGGRLEDNVDESVLAPENQERIFSALCSVWNLISTWDLEEPITLVIGGRYFRSADERLADLAVQKNIMRLVCRDAEFANPFDVFRIAKRAPELEKLQVKVRQMSKELCAEVANDISTWDTTLPKLNALRLTGETELEARQHRSQPEDMRVDGIDRLCRELRLLTQRDGFIALEMNFIPISAELWEDTQNPGSEMEWPTLKQMAIRVPEMSSTGKWLLLEGPKERTPGIFFELIPQYPMRTVVDKKEMQPLVELFKRSLKQMPELVSAKMEYAEDLHTPAKYSFLHKGSLSSEIFQGIIMSVKRLITTFKPW